MCVRLIPDLNSIRGGAVSPKARTSVVLRDTFAVGPSISLRRLVASTVRRRGVTGPAKARRLDLISRPVLVLNQMLRQPDTADESALSPRSRYLIAGAWMTFGRASPLPGTRAIILSVDRGLKCNSRPDSDGSVRRATCGRKSPVI